MSKPKFLSPRRAEALNSEITRAIDFSSCDYQDIFVILREQLAFMRKAERDEHGWLRKAKLKLASDRGDRASRRRRLMKACE